MTDDLYPPIHLAHADWSTSPKKRWITQAIYHGSRWHIHLPQRVDALLKGAPLTELSVALAQPDGRKTLLGVDMPLGVPNIVSEQTCVESFRELLSVLNEAPWHEFLTPCATHDEISVRRPFYPHRPKGSKRAHLMQALGVDAWEDLLRQCDYHKEGGAKPCPIFWTVGANQVGKAAIAGLKEWLVPTQDAYAMWPFDGSLRNLISRSNHDLLLAEVYPAEVYDWLGFEWGKGGKRTQEARAQQANKILNYLDNIPVHLPQEVKLLIEDGFGEHKDAEDPFDSMVGLVGMLSVLCGERELFEPTDPVVCNVEGWIFGRPPHHFKG